MKHAMNDMLARIIGTLARLTVARYRPAVVGVTGSVGKTSTKLAVAAVLGSAYRVRAASGNLNNELGLSLAVLGDWSPEELRLVSRDQPKGTARGRKLLFWVKVIFASLARLAVKDKRYPDVLVLEYGADRPGDIRRLLRIVRPKVSVITAVGSVPVHLEYYSGPEEVAREKGRLIDVLPANGFAVLNFDDETVMRLATKARARVLTYGFEKGAEVQAARFTNRAVRGRPAGIGFKIEHAGSSVPVTIPEVFGRAQAYAASAAASVGLIFGMNLVRISEALGKYRSADSRMQLLSGVKHAYLIDDSYNASPLSMAEALDTVMDLPAKRRIAVLGDMLEIGKYAPEAHEAVGRLAAKSVDAIFTVGPRAKFIASAARGAGLGSAAIFSFDTADEAAKPLQDFMKEGDLVLIKGSHSMELDKVVREVREVRDMTPSSSSLV